MDNHSMANVGMGTMGAWGTRTLLVQKLLLTLGKSEVIKASFQAQVLMTQSEDKSTSESPKSGPPSRPLW